MGNDIFKYFFVAIASLSSLFWLITKDDTTLIAGILALLFAIFIQGEQNVK